jgi:hypothetical protein
MPNKGSRCLALPIRGLKRDSQVGAYSSTLSMNMDNRPLTLFCLISVGCLSSYMEPRLLFHKVFARPRPKTLNLKAKKIATRPKTGNF